LTNGIALNLKASALQKKQSNRVKRQFTEWEKIVSSNSFNRQLILRIYKNSKYLVRR
jgi:hypothetical protein